MKNKDNFICQRCRANEVLFFCYSCPKQINKLCSDCDTYIHSIIPYKNLHLRDKIENIDEYKYFKERQIKNEKNKGLEEENKYQINIINQLNLRIEELQKNIYKLIEEIKKISIEKESYIKELNNLKTEIESHKKENKHMKNTLNENKMKIAKLNDELISENNKLKTKESELEEMNFYFNNKISDSMKENKYLLNELENLNNMVIKKSHSYKEIVEENHLLNDKILNLEHENKETLKIILQLRRENQELIRRLNNYIYTLNN